MKLGPTKISAIYIITGCLWITLSDKLLFRFGGVSSPETLQTISNLKGVFFVLITGLILRELIKLGIKRLSESEEQYRSMYEGSIIPMWIYDPDTLKFVSVNNAAVVNYGYTQDQFLQMVVYDIGPAADREKIIKAVKGAQLRMRHDGIWNLLKADGTPVVVNITSQPVKVNGKVHNMVTAYDITDKIRYEETLKTLNEELKAGKEKLSETQQLAKVGGWEFYVEEKQLVWSDEMYMIMQIEPVKNHNLYNLYMEHVYADDRELMTNALSETINHGKPLDVILRVKLSNGNTCYIRHIGKPDFKNGKPYRISGSTQDVTEFKQLEIERNKYLFSFENTLSSINEGFYTLDYNLAFTKVNKRFELETGLPASALIGKKLEDVYPGVKSRLTYKQYQKALNEQVSIKFEAYWRHFKKWHAVSVYPIEDGIAVYFNDITDRVEKDIRLEHAVMRYETVAKATQDVIYDYEIATDKLLFYTDVTSLLDITPDKVGNTKAWWRSFVHPDDINTVATTQRQAMAEGETNWHCEYRIRVADGRYKYVYSQGYIIYDDDLQPTRLVGAVKDIDEFKRINEENKRLAEIITKINNMVVVMDVEHRITWINKAFEDYIGYTLNEVKGKQPGEFLGGPRINPDTLTEIFERKARLETFTLDIKHYLKSGISQWANVEYTPMFDNSGQHTGYIAVHRNITQRKEREDLIISQNRILQEISWSSSHEIRKPVASILALSQLANDPAETNDREQIIRMIGQCAKELDIIVHNISNKVNNELLADK
jgi:PAS domain S-box-containing protein